MPRKKRMFKQLANVHVENIGSAGNWNSFLRIEKQQAQMVAAYADSCRISFVLKTDVGESHAGGYLFAVSNSSTMDETTPSNNSQEIISASACGRLGGGVVTLPLKRLIRRNEDDNESGEGYIYIWVRSTNMSSGTALEIETMTEVMGRWHNIVAL